MKVRRQRELVLCFHHVGPRDPTQVIRLASMYLYLWVLLQPTPPFKRFILLIYMGATHAFGWRGSKRGSAPSEWELWVLCRMPGMLDGCWDPDADPQDWRWSLTSEPTLQHHPHPHFLYSVMEGRPLLSPGEMETLKCKIFESVSKSPASVQAE